MKRIKALKIGERMDNIESAKRISVLNCDNNCSNPGDQWYKGIRLDARFEGLREISQPVSSKLESSPSVLAVR